MKVLYNDRRCGFAYSSEFIAEFAKRHPGKSVWCSRADPDVIALFEEFGSARASDKFAKLEVTEVPDGVQYEIREFDGLESVHWSLPFDAIIQELVHVVQGRKPLAETGPFTQRLVNEDLTPLDLRRKLRDEMKWRA
jgi:hypothetical protein